LLPASELALRISAAGFALVLYGAFWVLAAAAAGLVSRSSSRAIALAGVLWVVSAWLVPSGLRWAAAERRPVGPRTEYVNQLRDLPETLQVPVTELRQTFLSRHPEYRELPRLTPFGSGRLDGAARGEELSRRAAQLEEAYDKQRARREHWIDSVSWATPSMLAAQALASAAGSDAAFLASVDRQKRAYQTAIDRFYWPRIFEERLFTSADYDGIPRFAFRAESAALAIQRVLRPGALLVGWVAGIAVLVWLLLLSRRYRCSAQL
jgi:hypothetical protein